MSKLIESVHTLVIDGDMPAKAIASAIGKPYSTLLRECNPYGKGAKLSAETLMAILKATGPRMGWGDGRSAAPFMQ